MWLLYNRILELYGLWSFLPTEVLMKVVLKNTLFALVLILAAILGGMSGARLGLRTWLVSSIVLIAVYIACFFFLLPLIITEDILDRRGGAIKKFLVTCAFIIPPILLVASFIGLLLAQFFAISLRIRG
jgi:hypothetical protein